jgi:predicted amidohydrolase YtcJ
MTDGRTFLFTHADLGDGTTVDVRVRGDRIVQVGPDLAPRPEERQIDARGAALLPGLHDHHLHLLALAASLTSVRCRAPFAATLRGAPTGTDGWIRAIDYHEAMAGPLDRWALDEIVADRPVRVQHRSGALGMVNSSGADLLGLEGSDRPGIERNAGGIANGRLWRLDGWMRERLGSLTPDLRAAGALLADFGITGVTDATPDLDASTIALLGAATADGRLPQRVHLLGAPLDAGPAHGMSVGPYKLLLHDHDLPAFDDLIDRIRAARAAGRGVAVHCVTRDALALTLAALDEVGPAPDDRIEHGSVMPPELVALVAKLGLRVITQPIFVADRGDAYLAEVDVDDQPYLYPHASLLAAGIRAVASSDAPFGDPDPWRTLAAARDRTLTVSERVDVSATLAGLLSPLDDPGGPPRQVMPGARADLCLLHVPWADALENPSRDLVRHTVCRGTIVL